MYFDCHFNPFPPRGSLQVHVKSSGVPVRQSKIKQRAGFNLASNTGKGLTHSSLNWNTDVIVRECNIN